MCDLTAYFNKDEVTYKNEGIIVFDFDDTKSMDFITNSIIPFREAYVSNEVLNTVIDNKIRTRGNAIGDRLPTKPTLQSGEFGEVLVFYLIQKFMVPDANIVPIKWRWKEHKDEPCHLTDVILLKCDDTAIPQTSDYVYTVEVKSAATRTTKNILDEAIKGAIKDEHSRIGKTIIYLMNQFTRDNDIVNAKKLTRFEDGVTVPYYRKINAAIVVERGFMSHNIHNLSAESKTQHNGRIELFVIPITNLKSIYEALYRRMPNEG